MSKKQIEITLFLFSTVLFAVGIYLSISIDSHQKTIYWIAAVLATVGAVGPSIVEKLSFSPKRVNPICYTPEKRVEALALVNDNPDEKDNEGLRKLTVEVERKSGAEKAPEDYLLLSTSAHRGGSLEEALRYAYWGLFNDNTDIKVKAALFYRLGSVFVELDKDLLAADKFHKAIELDPAFSWTHGRLGMLYEKMGRHDDAEKVYKDALRLAPNEEVHQNNLNLFYKKVETLNVPDREGQVPLILDHGDKGVQFDMSLDELTAGGDDLNGAGKSKVVHELGLHPDSAVEAPVSVQSNNLFEDVSTAGITSDVKEITVDVETSVLPEEALIVEEVGDGELPPEAEGKDDAASPVVKEALVVKKVEPVKAGDDTSSELRPVEGRKEADSGEDSEYKFKKATGRAPHDCIDQYNLGLLYQRMGKLDDAERAYKEALELDPAYVKTHNNLGLLYQRLENFEEAEKAYKEALVLDPSFSWAHSNLGSLYKKMGNFEEAEKSYREALRLDPDDSIAEYNLGLLYQALGRNIDAENAYREALRLDPNYIKAHFNLGNLYKKMGKKEDAEKAYRSALRLEPNDASAQYNLGLLYHSMDRLEESEEAYMAALTINPEYIKSHNNLGILYEGMERFDDAERSYKRAITLDPSYVKAKNNLALLTRKIALVDTSSDGSQGLSDYKDRAVKGS